ncbi:MAG: recombinase family protein, partial [Oscillospiraceae bacterium]|nr:recombinase family protein [Oscillospiraceae bacterium]
AIAKAQGKYKGRQPIAIDWIKFGQLYELWKSDAITAVEFQKRMGIRPNTFYRRLREYENRQK